MAAKSGGGSGSGPPKSGAKKWAYFGVVKGASGKTKHIGWVQVGSHLWKSLTRPVGRGVYLQKGAAPSRPALTPKKFAKSVGNPAKIKTGPVGSPDARDANAVASGRAKSGSGGAVNAQGANKKILARNVAGPKAKSGGGGKKSNAAQARSAIGGTGAKVGKIIPQSEAAKIAKLQFGGQIDQTNQQIAQGKIQAAQDLHDISNWYGQVQQQNAASQQASQQGYQHAATADQNSTSALLAAIGGGANAGSGQVAAQGSGNAALMQAMQAIGQQSQGQMNTALGNASAGASSAQQALNDQANQALQSQLTSLQGQQGDAQAQALMQIIQANNATLQQRFQNRLSSLSAEESAAMLPGQLQLQNQQVQQARQVTKAQGSAGSGGFVPWAKLDAGTQTKLAQGWMISSNGQNLVKPNIALARARAQGYTNPAVANYIMTLYH